MRCSRILVSETVPQFHEGKGYQGIKMIFEFENISDVKKIAITEKKVKQIIYTNQGYLPTKVTPVIDLQMNQSLFFYL